MTNVAVIGTGSMGRHHARVYSALDSCNLIAVAEKDKEVGQQIAEKYGCKYYEDYKEMIEKEDIDVVSVVVPTKIHKDIALECMKKIKAVLVEKPISLNIEDAKKMVNKANESGVKLMVGHIERFNPAVRKLKEVIKSGKLGDIISVTSRRVGLFPSRIKDANVILDLAVHDIDVCNFLIGKQVKEIFSTAGRAVNSNREDYSDIFIKYRNGPNLFIQVNWLTPVKIRKLYVTGTNGYAELNYITQELVLYKSIPYNEHSGFEELVRTTTPKKEIISVEKGEPLEKELRCFLSYANGEDCLSSGEDGLKALSLALKSVESYTDNKTIRVDDD